MYGQWRTASKLIEYQKEFYRSRYGVEIDIFADIKMDHTYLNTRFTADSEKAGLEDIEAGLTNWSIDNANEDAGTYTEFGVLTCTEKDTSLHSDDIAMM